MPFAAKCSFCPATVRLPDSALAASVRCPKCQSYFTAVPAEQTSSTAVARGRRASKPKKQATADDTAMLREDLTADLPDHRESVWDEPNQRPAVSLAVNKPKPINAWGVAALCLVALALAGASLSWLHWLTLPAAIVGIVLGGIGWFGRQDDSWRCFAPPVAGAFLNIMLVVITIFWPSLLSVSLHRSWETALTEVDEPRLVHKRDPFDLGRPGDNPEWLDASSGVVKWKDAQIAISDIHIGVARFQTPRGRVMSKKKYLFITLRIHNAGGTRVLRYRSWERADPEQASLPELQDDQGGRYMYRNPTFKYKVNGWTRNALLIPGENCDDVLVFDAPARKINYWKLTLPATAWGETGTLKLQIPAAMLDRKAGVPD